MPRLAPALVLGLTLASAGAAHAQTQVTVPMQGVLTDAAGEPVVATVSMTFSLYANAGAATPLWSEAQQVAVGMVFPGVYQVQLGSITALAAELFRDNPAVHVGVRVGADPADLGRWPIGASPKAATTALGTVPEGGSFDRAAADPLYVNISGDTMTGPLVLPQGGLRVGTNGFVTDSSGRIGVGLTPTTNRFEVSGGTTRVDIRATAGLMLDLNGSADFLFREVSGSDDLVQIGRLYHNVSSGALGVGRQPNTVAASWIKLDVAGPIAIDGNGVLSRDVNGLTVGDVASADGLIPNLFLKTNDTVRMTIDGSGNVGVGTSSAGAAARLRVGGGNLRVDIGPETASNTLAFGQVANGDAVVWIPNFGEAGIQFKSGQTGTAGDRITFRANGRVGIGTIRPASELDVRGQIRALSLCFDADCRSSWASIASSAWERGNGTTVLANAGDRVGIGSAAPDTKLHLYTSAAAATDLLRLESDPVTASRQEVGMNFVADDGSGGRFQSARIWSQFSPTGDWNDGNLYLGAGSGTPSRITIKGSGNVGVGIDTPLARLDVNGDLRVRGSLVVTSGIRLGNDTGTCDMNKAGVMRWTGTAFQGCDGVAWRTFSELTATTQTAQYASCKQIFDAGRSTGDGAYEITINTVRRRVWCDMTNGGWTLAGWQYANATTSLGVADRGTLGDLQSGFSTDLEGVAYEEIMVFNRTFNERFTRRYTPSTWGRYTPDFRIGSFPTQFRQGVYGPPELMMVCIDYSYSGGDVVDYGCDNDWNGGQKGHIGGWAGEFCPGARLDGTWAWSDGTTCRYRGQMYIYGFGIR